VGTVGIAVTVEVIVNEAEMAQTETNRAVAP
jgi:hypothetical protein